MQFKGCILLAPGTLTEWAWEHSSTLLNVSKWCLSIYFSVPCQIHGHTSIQGSSVIGETTEAIWRHSKTLGLQGFSNPLFPKHGCFSPVLLKEADPSHSRCDSWQPEWREEATEDQGQGEGCKPMGSLKQEIPRGSVRVAAPDGHGRTNPEAWGTISLGWVINNSPPH